MGFSFEALYLHFDSTLLGALKSGSAFRAAVQLECLQAQILAVLHVM